MCSFCKLQLCKRQKTPQLEQPFLSDQRGPRKMSIGSIDLKETCEINKKRKIKLYLYSLTQPGPSNSTEAEQVSTDDDTNSSIETNTDEKYEPPQTSLKRICLQIKKDIPQPPKSNKDKMITKFKKLPYFAEACDRVGVSDRGAAFLSTSLLEDIGVVQKNSSDNIIDR